MASSALGSPDQRWYDFAVGRLSGLRTNRYSFWTHWRELADFFLPRRYKWLITPNQQSRGSPINQHIIDSTGVLAARNCASGLLSGKTSPLTPWFSLRLGYINDTQSSPEALWLAACKRVMQMVFHESNFYNSIAQFYYDLVIFGTAVVIIFEDYDNVINCYNPCAGEYYVDLDGKYRPCILYREFVMTVSATVDEFGLENCSVAVKEAFKTGGTAITREILIAHAIEPNNDGRDFGISDRFAYRECYWEQSSSQSPQGGKAGPAAFLRRKGYHEQAAIIGRWDITGNDAYGRSVAMDALGDQKQLQVETRRKGQAIDKGVNPPLVADAQLKNQPASLMPGAMTFVNGFSSTGNPGIASIYDSKFPVKDVVEDIREVQARLKYTFYNHLFQPISQFETRSNITAYEISERKAESLIMLGPVFERIDNEVLAPIFERVWAICSRAGIFPEAPPSIQGKELTVKFVSMLAQAQESLEAGGLERTLQFAGSIEAILPGTMDNINVDFVVDKYTGLVNNDPRILRNPEEVAAMREKRAKDQAAVANAEMAKNLAPAAQVAASADIGNGQTALQTIMGGGA